ncbi:cytochrome c3 family protein [Bacillus sp. T33-2]|uniref:cytochrome c3 family protein n=1 Tax=Bacillus sp. T33-2 TaxID=2054168 RepID=UPI000C769A2A|nr:NapC/NirT family cytochrome c [Bacillus sp. T33-2]PLR91921.1 cytochrome C [Bacillus sp. T33-2]
MSTLGFRKKKKTETEETEIRDKKPGLVRRLWRKFRAIDWKNPVNRWRALFVVLFASIAMFGVAYGAIAYTSEPQFCSFCHEMSPEFITFEESAHSQIKCVQCHVDPGVVNTVIHKVESLKEVYYHVVGPPDPIVQTVPVMNKNCTQCHSENRLVTATGDLIVNHEGHIKEDIPCITCHSGVAHAKVVERGINHQKDLDFWKKENAEKLVKAEYMKPNMGTCIDCHDKVNKGERPWKDIQYSLPENTHGEKHEEKADGHAEAATLDTTEAAAPATTEVALSEEEQKALDDKHSQEIILQAIGKQKKDVKLSMECSTCHKEVSTPANHQSADWNLNHGGNAVEELDKCLNCHQDQKWIKKLPKQDIVSLIEAGATKDEYKPNLHVVKTDSRESNFCSSCHAYRPPGHLQSDEWLTAHADKAKTDNQKAECYVCHERAKPDEASKVKAPTDVYCEFCHRTGFKKS